MSPNVLNICLKYSIGKIVMIHLILPGMTMTKTFCFPLSFCIFSVLTEFTNSLSLFCILNTALFYLWSHLDNPGNSDDAENILSLCDKFQIQLEARE